MIKAPVALLLNPDLSATAKVVWLVHQLHARTADIQSATGFSRTTILRGLSQLAGKTWSHGPTVVIPRGLLEDPKVGAQAKLLYGLLKARPASFTSGDLATHAGLSPHTVRRATKALADAGWLRVWRKNRLAPFSFTLSTPEREQDRQEADRIQRRIRRAQNKGEQIMREYLSLLVGAEEFEDNAYMSFLTNPFTGEMLQLDRYYKARVAFEFNGPGHYDGPEAPRQRARDYLKRGMCHDAGITLVTVHPEDLTLDRMRQKVGDLLPTRDPRPELARAVALEGRQYLATAGSWKGPAQRKGGASTGAPSA